MRHLLGTDLLLRERGKAEVWLDNPELGEESLGLLIRDGGCDDNIVTRNPVDGCRNTVFVACLERVNDAEDLGGVATSGCGIAENGANLLFGVDEEDRANGEGNAFGIDIRGILVVNPAFCQQ